MELRRRELLADENGYWRQRMMMEQRAASLSGMSSGGMVQQAEAEEPEHPASTTSPEVCRARAFRFTSQRQYPCGPGAGACVKARAEEVGLCHALTS